MNHAWDKERTRAWEGNLTLNRTGQEGAAPVEILVSEQRPPGRILGPFVHLVLRYRSNLRPRLSASSPYCCKAHKIQSHIYQRPSLDILWYIMSLLVSCQTWNGRRELTTKLPHLECLWFVCFFPPVYFILHSQPLSWFAFETLDVWCEKLSLGGVASHRDAYWWDDHNLPAFIFFSEISFVVYIILWRANTRINGPILKSKHFLFKLRVECVVDLFLVAMRLRNSTRIDC